MGISIPNNGYYHFFLFAVTEKSRIFATANVDRFVMIATT
jgi:hypothetical protein